MKASVRIIAAAALVLGSSAAFADSMDMTVQANVVGTCRMATTPIVDFGTLNQVTAPNLTAPGSPAIEYRCTKNTAASAITLGGVASPFIGSLSNGVDNIPYQITWSNSATQGAGLGSGAAVISVGLTATMSGTDYQNVSAGNYAETVAVVVTP